MKISRTYRQLLVMVLIFVAGWFLFSLISYWNKETIEKGSMISDSNKTKTAVAIRSLILSEFDTISTPEGISMINQMAQRFIDEIGDSSIHWKFYILDENIPNAFATLDGEIYFNKGLIELADSPELFSAVMAHEMGHIVHNDFEKRLAKNIGVSTLMQIVAGGDPTLVGELSKTVFSTKYDRGQEEDADAFALELLEKSGVNPNNVAAIFMALQREENLYHSENMDLFMSHPNLKERIKTAINYQVSDSFQTVPFEVDWQRLKEIVLVD